MIELAVETNGKTYEISNLVEKVSYNDRLNDGASKLEFTFMNDDVDIVNGSIVRFVYGDVKFYGYVFRVSKLTQKKVTITSYDQLRYVKAKDTIVLMNDTVTTATTKMCNYFNLRKGILINTGYVLSTSVKDDKTWLDIIHESIRDTLRNTGRWYTLKDNFGEITLFDLSQMTLDLVLGDGSLMTEYEYTKSIDDEFYNQIKIVSDNETTKKRDTYITKDSSSIKKYGLLQYFEVLDKNVPAAQMKNRANMLLKLYNREYETLTLKCLGDTSVKAGSSFYVDISEIGLKAENNRLIVKSVTHNFLPYHTMDIEVAI